MSIKFLAPSQSEIAARPSHEDMVAEILRKDFMKPLGLTPKMIARAVSPDRRRADEFLENLESFLSDPGACLDLPDCLLLDRFFGLSDGWFWRLLDIREVREAVAEMGDQLDKVRPFRSPAKPGRTTTRRFEGKLFDWFETGLEGVVWALQDDLHEGYDGLRVIEKGDHLTVFGARRRVLWSGTIRKDRKTGARPRPGNPKFIQPVACGCWVHWIQKGFKPDRWAKFFMRPEGAQLHAILIKKKGRRNPEDPR